VVNLHPPKQSQKTCHAPHQPYPTPPRPCPIVQLRAVKCYCHPVRTNCRSLPSIFLLPYLKHSLPVARPQSRSPFCPAVRERNVSPPVSPKTEKSLKPPAHFHLTQTASVDQDRFYFHTSPFFAPLTHCFGARCFASGHQNITISLFPTLHPP